MQTEQEAVGGLTELPHNVAAAPNQRRSGTDRPTDKMAAQAEDLKFVGLGILHHDAPISELTKTPTRPVSASNPTGWLAPARILAQLQENGWILAAVVFALVLTGSIEWLMGRSLLGPDGRFGLWAGDIWSSENSQRLADPYSFTHICHGMVFYALLWVSARKMPVRYRLLLAVFLESSWEILENSPIIIDRYRQVTISLGYTGDSILNSLSDILMMSAGFLFASKARPWIVLAVFVGFELGCAVWVRDNLTLNIIMLLHPLEAIKAWQSAGHPGL